MARKTADAVFDAALQHLIDNADQIVFCEGEPADHAAATSDKGSGGVALGETSVAAGDFSILDGDTSGRKLRFGGAAALGRDWPELVAPSLARAGPRSRARTGGLPAQ